MLWCFLGIFGDKKGRNLNIFLKVGCRLRRFRRLCLAVFIVSTGGRCAGSLCYFADVSKIGQDTAGCSAFCPLYRFALGALLANMALFRVLRAFLAGFGRFVWVCVACVLCVACGAFVRVSG